MIVAKQDTTTSGLSVLVMSGANQGQHFVVDRPILLGRDPKARLRFSDDLISRHHSLIEVVGSKLMIRDLGSKNGTFVNGQEITEPFQLRVNDRVRIGRTLLAVVMESKETRDSSTGAEVTNPDEDYKMDSEPIRENIQIKRSTLRRATELTARIGALCKVRHSLSAIVSVIRKEFRADTAGVFMVDPPFEPSFVEGPLQLTEENITFLQSWQLGGSNKAIFVQGKTDVTPLRANTDRMAIAFPLRINEETRAVFILRRDESRAFDHDDLQFAETLSECIRVIPLHKVLSEGQPEMLPDHLGIVGSSEAMQQVRELLRSYAEAVVTVLIRGESGTGKELCARAIAQLSPRRFGPYVELNCACMLPELIEAELFGHERGAFTGAASRRIGKLEIADGGTLFLDEIGEIPIDLQAKLLRVLEGQAFYRLGGTEQIKTEIRFICATNRDLEAMVEEGKFRRDLYHRINILTIELPPLRQHLEDIPELVPYLMNQIKEELPERRDFTVTPKAYRRLLSHSWPGNVRELENMLQRVMLMTDDTRIDEKHIPEGIGDRHDGTTIKLPRLQVLTEMMEREEISRALVEAGGQKSQAAKLLGISRPTLDKKIKTYNLASLTSNRSKTEGVDTDQSD